MQFQDFTLRARDWDNGQFQVEVTDSPADRMRKPQEVRFNPDDLSRPLRNLERKRIRPGELISLGEALAELLLPPQVREMFVRCLDAAERNDKGLRLRLVLDDPEIADLPWEYVYLQQATGEKGLDGFLALNPGVSIVRHEAIPKPIAPVTAAKPMKAVVGLSSPKDAASLDLKKERELIAEALQSVENLNVEFVEHLCVTELQSKLHGAHIFHYAGHGVLGVLKGKLERRSKRDLVADQEDEEADEHVGQPMGAILLESATGHSDPFPAEQLALTLRAAGVRVAVFGACETGRRDGVNVWTGVAPALMKADIPAAVAMQYVVYDDSAIAFAREFYESLATGLSLDEAVAAGRLAILNHEGSNGVDWGVPVLYMRSADGVVFPETAEDKALEQTRDHLRVSLRQRIDKLSGRATAVDVGTMTSGTVEAKQKIKEVEKGGEATGVKIKDLG